MLYSELRTQQDEEMKRLLAERFTEVEHFRKLNNAAWGNPNMYAKDIERVEALYTAKIQNLRQKHAREQERYTQDNNKTAAPNRPETRRENNPVDISKISDYAKPEAIKPHAEEPKEAPKKKRYYRRK